MGTGHVTMAINYAGDGGLDSVGYSSILKVKRRSAALGVWGCERKMGIEADPKALGSSE